MQLKKSNSVRATLAAATTTLLSTGAAASPAQAAEWETDSAVLLYSEIGRVSLIEPVISARRGMGDGRFLSLRLVWDALTGASANGAVPSDVPQTFSTPSGEGSYSSNPGEIPLDTSFHDLRAALNLSWERPFGQDLQAIFGVNVSREFDYTSLGVSAEFKRDINARNTTLSIAVAGAYDRIHPIGGVPTAGSRMFNKRVDASDASKSVHDLMLGITQAVSRFTLAQLNFSYGTNRGYLTDPYKIVSLVEDDAANSANNPLGSVLAQVYEARPRRRQRQAVYTKWVHHLQRDVIRAAYRYFWDDWGIHSHTVDLRYRYEFNRRVYLQPHLRYYRQDAADFYRYFLKASESLDAVSADYRLGDMRTKTIGILLGREGRRASEFTLRVEWLVQSGEGHPAQAIGKLRQQDLFPDITAYLFQAGYSFTF